MTTYEKVGILEYSEPDPDRQSSMLYTINPTYENGEKTYKYFSISIYSPPLQIESGTKITFGELNGQKYVIFNEKKIYGV